MYTRLGPFLLAILCWSINGQCLLPLGIMLMTDGSMRYNDINDVYIDSLHKTKKQRVLSDMDFILVEYVVGSIIVILTTSSFLAFFVLFLCTCLYSNVLQYCGWFFKNVSVAMTVHSTLLCIHGIVLPLN